MTAKLPRWSLTLVLALAAWGGITRVSAQTASPARGDAGAPVAAPAAVASANVEWSEGDSTTVDSLALDRDPIESSPLIPVTGFSWVLPAVPLGPVVDPEWGLFHSQRALWDPVEPARLGSLSPELHFRVNGETYRFATERNLRRFMLAPKNWCGLVRDPVTGRKFQPTRKSPEAYWIGGPYFFESESTWTQFVEDPHRYAIIRRM